jgi:hypothetical protein
MALGTEKFEGDLKRVRHLFMSAAFVFLSPTDVGERVG